MQIAVWKPVVGYEDLYKVNNLGEIFSIKNQQLLKPNKDNKGYLRVNLYNWSESSKSRTFLVHTIVMLTFKGPRPKGMEICHNDGRPENNKLDNLRYDTKSANNLDKKRHGTVPTRTSSKITEDQVISLKTEWNDTSVSVKELSDKYGIHHASVRYILRGDTWAEIGPALTRKLRTKAKSQIEVI